MAGPNPKDDRSPVERILEDAQLSQAGLGAEGRTWTRDDLYRDRLDRYGSDDEGVRIENPFA